MSVSAINRLLLYTPSVACLAVGAAYLLGPVDLIPDRTPYVGHLDEAAFIVLTMVGAFVALPAKLDKSCALRRSGMAIVSATSGPALFRLCLGRWPDAFERGQFGQALRDNRIQMPPLLRAMQAVPASDQQISRFLLFALLRDGRLPASSATDEPVRIAPQVGDPLSFWEGRPVSFLHLEKTAGTALANLLTERFHPLQIDPDPQRSMPPQYRCPFPTPSLPTIRQRKLVWGHYDLPSLLRLGSDRLIVTMLREPRARILSLYRYWRSVEPATLQRFSNDGVKLAHRLDLLDFLRHDDTLLRDSIDNLYVRRLTGWYGSSAVTDPLSCDPAGALDEARRMLDRLDFVGIMERMDDSLAGLSATLLAPFSRDLPADNRTEANASARPKLFRPTEASPVTEAVEIELDRLTSLDRVIYAECLARLDDVGSRRAA